MDQRFVVANKSNRLSTIGKLPGIFTRNDVIVVTSEACPEGIEI